MLLQKGDPHLQVATLQLVGEVEGGVLRNLVHFHKGLM